MTTAEASKANSASSSHWSVWEHSLVAPLLLIISRITSTTKISGMHAPPGEGYLSGLSTGATEPAVLAEKVNSFRQRSRGPCSVQDLERSDRCVSYCIQ